MPGYIVRSSGRTRPSYLGRNGPQARRHVLRGDLEVVRRNEILQSLQDTLREEIERGSLGPWKRRVGEQL